MGSCITKQPVVMPESTLPQKVSEKDVEILMEKIADEIKIEEDEKLRQTLRHLNTI